MKCEHCGEPLNKSVYSPGKTLKSCPRCSKANGQYHVFHAYPGDFGTTEKRVSRNSPDGAQSFCMTCRGDGVPKSGKLCINTITEDPPELPLFHPVV